MESSFWNKIAKFDLRKDGAYLARENILERFEPRTYSLDPKNLDIALIYYWTGYAYSESGRHKKALEAYRKVETLNKGFKMRKDFRQNLTDLARAERDK